MSYRKWQKEISDHSDLVKSISFQGMIFQAKTGKIPSLAHLQEIKKDIIFCRSNVNSPKYIDEKLHSYALERTSAMVIEGKLQNKDKINACFINFVESVSVLEKTKSLNEKSKQISISI